jgi:hypothetical protein
MHLPPQDTATSSAEAKPHVTDNRPIVIGRGIRLDSQGECQRKRLHGQCPPMHTKYLYHKNISGLNDRTDTREIV